jgi:hypothetical protein
MAGEDGCGRGAGGAHIMPRGGAPVEGPLPGPFASEGPFRHSGLDEGGRGDWGRHCGIDEEGRGRRA